MKTAAWTLIIWAFTTTGQPSPTYMNGLTHEGCKANKSRVITEASRLKKSREPLRLSVICVEQREHKH